MNGLVDVCIRQCEGNAADLIALGCGAESDALSRCMNDNIVCKNGDYDILHIAQVCRAQGDALSACEMRDGGPPDDG
jgi:hypothetical protein